MKQKAEFITSSVRILTLLAICLVSGCSIIYDYVGESCNSHAYTQIPIREHINARFHLNAPVRMAVIPFSVPANLSASSDEQPGLGNELAWQVQAKLLKTGDVPIVEVFNRQDWPGKKAEFFTGNYGALAMAREAGYDMVMVGLVEKTTSLNALTVYTKILDVDSGITVFYGQEIVHSQRRRLDDIADTFWIIDKDPSLFYNRQMMNKASECIVTSVTSYPDEEL